MGLTLIIKMQNDENTNDLEVVTKDEETVEVEETTTEETVESKDTIAPNVKMTYEQKLASAKTPEEKFAIADAEAHKNRRLLGKQKPGNVFTPTQAPQQASPLDVDERILKSQGMPTELLTQLKKVASIEGLSLLDAQADPLFVAMKEKFEKEKRIKDASLGSSRGSGGAKARKTPTTPGLTREEHMAMFENRQ